MLLALILLTMAGLIWAILTQLPGRAYAIAALCCLTVVPICAAAGMALQKIVVVFGLAVFAAFAVWEFKADIYAAWLNLCGFVVMSATSGWLRAECLGQRLALLDIVTAVSALLTVSGARFIGMSWPASITLAGLALLLAAGICRLLDGYAQGLLPSAKKGRRIENGRNVARRNA